MIFPLQLSFKIVALAPQIQVTDAQGQLICYVRQKMFKLKEAVEVFTDSSRQQRLCQIKADRIIDFSATYHFLNNQDQTFGAVKRKGMRSLWRAHYEILQNDSPVYEIREENAWAKVMDGFFSEIPLLGMFSGYLFHPRYQITRISDGQQVIQITKKPAFWEGRFEIQQLLPLEDADQLNLVLSTLMMVLMERRRG